MNDSHTLWHHAEVRLTHWLASSWVVLVCLSLGGIFVWFGVVPFIPDMSPAEGFDVL